jgi:AhpD family alkylhydroperoxidase
VSGPGEVPQRTKDLVGVLVGVLNHCRYTTSHRVRAARASGATDDELANLATGRWSGFTEAERIAFEYARQLTDRPPTVGHRESAQAVDGELLAQLRATYTDPQIVELTAYIGLWNALSRFHRVMAFDLDMDPPPAALDEVL